MDFRHSDYATGPEFFLFLPGGFDSYYSCTLHKITFICVYMYIYVYCMCM